MAVKKQYKDKPHYASLNGKKVGIGGDYIDFGEVVNEASEAEYAKLQKLYPIFFTRKKK